MARDNGPDPKALAQALRQQDVPASVPDETNYSQEMPAMSPEQLLALTQQYRAEAAQQRLQSETDPYWGPNRVPAPGTRHFWGQ